MKKVFFLFFVQPKKFHLNGNTYHGQNDIDIIFQYLALGMKMLRNEGKSAVIFFEVI